MTTELGFEAVKTHLVSKLHAEQKEINAEREVRIKRSIATPRTTIGHGTYVPSSNDIMRHGARDHERVPSLMGCNRHYRDGRVERND